MDFTSAKDRLRVHTGLGAGTDGFLNMLRPYAGLKPDVFADLAAAVVAVLPHLRGGAPLDHELINYLWGICFYSRYWGLNPGGLLQSNNLITPADVERLRTWVDAVDSAAAAALDGQDDTMALSLLKAIPASGIQ